jgi:thiamine biosynthesis lipoprotein
MGTELHVIAYTSAKCDEPATRTAIELAYAEIVRLEKLMTTWRDDSELAEVNRRAGELVKVSPDTIAVLDKSKWAGEISKGTFDVTYASMGPLRKFGARRKSQNRPRRQGSSRHSRIDWKKIEIDRQSNGVRIGKDQKLDVGSIARATRSTAPRSLRSAGVVSFWCRPAASYGAGRKPDGSPWVSGIRDPRGPTDRFATPGSRIARFDRRGLRALLHRRTSAATHSPRTGYPHGLAQR